jgi:FMN phosphatase YigB (HAD superfamily)
MNFVFDLYGTLVDIKTDENTEMLWRGVCRELGVDESFWFSIKDEYASLCKEKKLSFEHEIELLDVFGDMLE